MEEAETLYFGSDPSIVGSEIIEEVKRLCSRTPGVEEICLDFLEALDVLGLFSLTHFCNIACTSVTVCLFI